MKIETGLESGYQMRQTYAGHSQAPEFFRGGGFQKALGILPSSCQAERQQSVDKEGSERISELLL